MRYSFRSRLLIAVLAALAGCAAPAVAVAHGVNHARDAAHETSDQHHHAPEHAAATATEVAFHPVDGHGHPVLDVGATKRLSAYAAVVLAAQLKALPDPFTTTIIAAPNAGERVIGATATGPPPSLRAPPIL